MTIDLVDLLGPTGVRAAADVVRVVDPNSVTRWVRDGALVRPVPGVLALPAAMGTWPGRARAAVTWSGPAEGDGLLTGRGALALWDVVATPGGRVHLTIPRGHRAPPARDWLRVLRADLDGWGIRQELPVAMPPRALLDAWGLAHGRDGGTQDVDVARAAVIGALRRRLVRPRELQRALTRRPNLPGRAALLRLLDMVAGGSHSEFEIWGLPHLLDVPGLPPVQRQLALDTQIGTIHFDGGWEEACLGVELDGAAYHRQPEQHEYDLRRDAAVAARGWLSLRISYRRGHDEPAACRADIAQAYWARSAR